MNKAHKTVTPTSSQPARGGDALIDQISGSTAQDWRDGDLAPQYNKSLRGFVGIKRGTTEGKQIQGYDGPSRTGSDSAREAYGNASIDKSVYQNLMKSMRGGHLR
jgi:hypothetical protein